MAMDDADMGAFLQGFMGALFSNDPQALMERAQEAGRMIGEAAFQEHERLYGELMDEKLQPIKDSLVLLMPTVDKVGELLTRFESGEAGGMLGKLLGKAMKAE